jgi:hypothetical protein
MNLSIDLETVKKEIISDFLSRREPITREALLLCLGQHAFAYKRGYLSKHTKAVLDLAIKEIWEKEFDVEVADLVSSF